MTTYNPYEDGLDEELPVAELQTIGGKWSREWWADTGDRVVSTVAQAAIGTLTASQLPYVTSVDLPSVLWISGLAGVLAFLKAVAIGRR